MSESNHIPTDYEMPAIQLSVSPREGWAAHELPITSLVQNGVAEIPVKDLLDALATMPAAQTPHARLHIPLSQAAAPVDEFRFCSDIGIIYPDAREVYVDDRPVHLANQEFRLLALLARHCGKLVTRSVADQELWHGIYNHYGSRSPLGVRVYRLRRKLDEAYEGLGDPRTGGIVTVASEGLKLLKQWEPGDLSTGRQ